MLCNTVRQYDPPVASGVINELADVCTTLLGGLSSECIQHICNSGPSQWRHGSRILQRIIPIHFSYMMWYWTKGLLSMRVLKYTSGRLSSRAAFPGGSIDDPEYPSMLCSLTGLQIRIYELDQATSLALVCGGESCGLPVSQTVFYRSTKCSRSCELPEVEQRITTRDEFARRTNLSGTSRIQFETAPRL